VKNSPDTLRARATSCARARDTLTQVARLIDTAINHAVDGRCQPQVTAALTRAQRDISAAQGHAETRRQRWLKKADKQDASDE